MVTKEELEIEIERWRNDSEKGLLKINSMIQSGEYQWQKR